jgi:single-strand DNA-binding protein
MAAGINKVIIVGNLGRDPEVRYAQSGMAIAKLSVAVTERVKDGDSWKDHTEWFRVTVFGKTAENAGQYLQKGRQIYAEGRLKTEKYKDKDGVERTSVEVIANTLQFLGGGNQGSSGRDDEGGGRRGGGAPRSPLRDDDDGYGGRQRDDAPPPSDGFIDDDLPFMRWEPAGLGW